MWEWYLFWVFLNELSFYLIGGDGVFFSSFFGAKFILFWKKYLIFLPSVISNNFSNYKKNRQIFWYSKIEKRNPKRRVPYFGVKFHTVPKFWNAKFWNKEAANIVWVITIKCTGHNSHGSCYPCINSQCRLPQHRRDDFHLLIFPYPRTHPWWWKPLPFLFHHYFDLPPMWWKI